MADEAMPLVYDELRRLATNYLRRERPNHTLQPTALVNETYLQLRRERELNINNRAHFIGRAAHVMRRLLVDHARERSAAKRGAGWQRVSLSEADLGDERARQLVALDDALRNLASKDRAMVRLVELRYFVGLTLEEVAEVDGVSRSSVVLRWRRAKAWLHQELSSSSDELSPGRT
ncbi:MAG: ECF-type sigma factor [Myxococcota bacterium]